MPHPPDPAPSVSGTAAVVGFSGPRCVTVTEEPRQPLVPGSVRVQTLYSGISAGTEMTAYRGSNPYLTKHWDADLRLFTTGTHSFDYPVSGWGYSEVGTVVELSDETGSGAGDLAVADTVYGIWGHRSEAVLPAPPLAGRVLPAGVDPLCGVFARVGAIALNAVLAADVHLGEVAAVFGQGVLGLLATRLVTLSGGTVVAIDSLAPRLGLARAMGATTVVDAAAGTTAEDVKALVPGGVDVAIEISGSYLALQEATRSVCVDGRVVAAGFYQGDGNGLRLGEEFHHNRVRLLASQIGSVAPGLASRWTTERLHQVFMAQVFAGRMQVAPLVTHLVPLSEVREAYRLLDEEPASALQVVLDFRTAGERDAAPNVTSS